MSKKNTKTTEELTEEFFTAERAEYEKRVPAAFPRVETVKLAELTELTELGESEEAGDGDEVQKPARK
jgi:hypothetical protein